MSSLSYVWEGGEFTLVHVPGTRGDPYTFGNPSQVLAFEVPDFFIGPVPVTQACWDHIISAGNNSRS